MNTTTTTANTNDKPPLQAAGYIAGTLTGLAQMVMPVRMWITVIAAIGLVVFAFQTESPMQLTRALCVFVALCGVLIGSAVFQGRRR